MPVTVIENLLPVSFYDESPLVPADLVSKSPLLPFDPALGRWLTNIEPNATLIGQDKVAAIDDPPGSPQDTNLVWPYLVSTLNPGVGEWHYDRYRMQIPTERAGTITSVKIFLRYGATSSIGRWRWDVELEGEPGSRVFSPIRYQASALGVLEDFLIDIPHPLGREWTYEDLDRMILGYRLKIEKDKDNLVTQFYCQVSADVSPEGQAVSIGVSPLEVALEGP